jgi:hypothetical protein
VKPIEFLLLAVAEEIRKIDEDEKVYALTAEISPE